MKDIIKFNSLWIAFTLLFGCNLNMDLQPISEIGEGEFYKTDEDFNTAIVSCYNGLHQPLEDEWALTELRTDNSRLHMSQTASNIYVPLRDIDFWTITSEHLRVYDYWASTYHNISRANTILDKIDNIQNIDLKAQIQGEASFIRAYHYFNLVRLFGEVYLVDRRISATEAHQVPKASVEQLYGFIINDLKIASNQLPSSYSSENKGRVTSWAAKALLAKVYRTTKRYEEAKPLLIDIINNSGHQLLMGASGFDNVFDPGNELNDEIIFAIRYKAGGFGLGSPFANFFAPLNSGAFVVNGDGNHFNHPTMDLISHYEPNDLRKNTTFALGYIGGGGNFIDAPYVRKFHSPVGIRFDAENDWPVIRYADVLLLYAEALNETGQTEEAINYLNRVRERAGLIGYSAYEVSDANDFTEKLLLERRLELAFENQRWFDLLQFDRAVSTINTYIEEEEFYREFTFPINPVTSSQILLPIPQRELDIFNQIQ